jgi:ADP-ribosylglycohydrolase
MFEDAVKNGILGLVVGDALGVPVEFRSREELERDPVAGMRAYGTHHQPAGTWSDDSSMALCLMESLTKDVEALRKILCKRDSTKSSMEQ